MQRAYCDLAAHKMWSDPKQMWSRSRLTLSLAVALSHGAVKMCTRCSKCREGFRNHFSLHFFVYIYKFYFELNIGNKQAHTSIQEWRLMPWHLVANSALLVELCRGRGCGAQCWRRRIGFICWPTALGLEHSGTFPLPCVVHAPNANTAIVASWDEHGGQHVPADAPHGTVVLAELQCLQI